MTGKIKRTSLQSEIIKYIQKYIKDNHLSSGDKLPSQGDLMELMGVSRTALREAVKTMEAHHMLEVKNGKGVYVSDRYDFVLPLLNFAIEKELLLETLEVRKILERDIIRMVVNKSTEEELDELGKVAQVLIEKYRRGEPQTADDKQFHYMIYRLSHNRVLYDMILSLSNLIDKFWEFPLNMADPFLKSLPMHEELYYAIRERNVKKAQMINEQLLNEIYKDIQNQI